MRFSGYNSNGEYWYQVEEIDEIRQPYLNSYGYQQTLNECTEENHNQPMYLYQWIYQCLYDSDKVTKRTIVCNGKTEEYINECRPNINPHKEYAIAVRIPMHQFIGYKYCNKGNPANHDEYYNLADTWYDSEQHADEIYPIFRRVVYDNPELYTDGCGTSGGSLDFNGYYKYLDVWTIRFDHRTECQKVVDNTLKQIDDKVYKVTKFSFTNPPQTSDDKKKVAKVVYDWLGLQNRYDNEGEYFDQTIFSALSPDESPVCSSYALAYDYVLKKYNIWCMAVSGYAYKLGDNDYIMRHQWDIVNYNFNFDYPYVEGNGRAENYAIVDLSFEWSEYQSDQEKLYHWEFFNQPREDNKYIIDKDWINYRFADAKSTSYIYKGNTVYGWNPYDEEVHGEQFLRTVLGGIKEWGEREFISKNSDDEELENVTELGLVEPVADKNNYLFTDKEGNIYVL